MGLVWLAVLPEAAQAVLFITTGDPSYNTTAPAGALANSGWQYEGQWGSFLGTPIAPQYFITAQHIGGSDGQIFTFDRVGYSTTTHYDSADSDLTIWKIDGTFPLFAPLYTGSEETGQSLVVIGRGTARGSEVVVDSTLKGWNWGVGDGRQRWGENAVASIVNVVSGTRQLGEMLRAPFDNGAGPNEAHLSSGDSGGAVFIQDPSDSIWKLAGINYGVDGPYSLFPDGSSTFNAALYDQSGLYSSTGDPLAGPGSLYATRISSNLNWIRSVAVPEPSAYGLIAGLLLLGFAAVRQKSLPS